MNWWIVYLFLASNCLLGATDALRLTDQSPVPLGRHVQWIVVPPNDPAYKELRPGAWMDGRPRQQGFADVLNYSFTADRYWFELKLENDSTAARTMVIETATAWLDHVRIFSGKEFQDMKVAGDMIPHREWSEQYRYPAFTVTIPPASQSVFWISIQSHDNMVIPLSLWSADRYVSWDRQRSLYFGLYHGLMLTIGLLNAAMYIFSRRRAFLIYTLYISSYAILQFNLDGFLPESMGFLPPWFLNHLNGTLNFTTVGFAGLFAVNFLETRKYAPRLARFIDISCKGFVVIGIALFSTPFYGFSVRAALFLTILYAPVVLICAIKAMRIRTRSAAFFTVAWAPLVFSIVLLGLTAFGVLPSSVYSRSFIYFGIAMEFIILSIGLGDQLARSIRHHAVVLSNLEAAEAVQKALIPAMPDIPGFSIHSWYQAAESTGGDWFDVIEDRRHQRLYCFIGDVTGHGISSTLVTSAVAGSVHSFLEEKFQSGSGLEATLHELVACVNRTVHRTGVSSGRLLTMNLIGIDMVTYEGILLNAGHCHPILFRESKVLPLASHGSMLGLTEDIRITQKNFALVPGDVLFLYSDGLIHRHSEANVELKLHRIMQLGKDIGSAEKIVNLVKGKYIETYGPHQLEDDCSLLAIELKASAARHQTAS